jgi:hypothetical protein
MMRVLLTILVTMASCSSSPPQAQPLPPAESALAPPLADGGQIADGRQMDALAPALDAQAAPPRRGALTLEAVDAKVPLSMPLDQFLGMSRVRVEGFRGNGGREHDDGWVAYGKGWALEYQGECAVELVVRLPGGTGCTGSLHGIGFAKRGFPLRRSSGCKWPERSIRHSLGSELAGELDFATGIFRAWLVGDRARSCAANPKKP